MVSHESILAEMVSASSDLRLAAESTKHEIDRRMRATVMELVKSRYAFDAKPIKRALAEQELVFHARAADVISDLILGFNPRTRRHTLEDLNKYIKHRPLRSIAYVMKLVDVFPAEYLTNLLRSSLRMTPDALISWYEVRKGEALSREYECEPTEIDLSSITNTCEGAQKGLDGTT